MLGRVFSTAVTNAGQGLIDLVRSNTDRLILEPHSEETDRSGDLIRLGREECLQLLASRRVGRYAHVESARALAVVPVNYISRQDGSVLFHTGPGPKLSAADRKDVVAFQVDSIDEETQTGWSILVVGRARRLTASESQDLDDLPVPWATGPRHHVVLIEPTRIEGRRLT